jgi:hypothetical protein
MSEQRASVEQQASSPVTQEASKPQTMLQPLGFVASVLLIMICLFAARATVTQLGFTNFRMFEAGVNWLQVMTYFGIAMVYYLIGNFIVNVVRTKMRK